MGIKERREKEKQERRERILKAAQELFSSRGFKETTMDEIARRCELGKGTVYYYFKSKSEIFQVLFREITQDFYLSISGIIGQSEGLTQFTRKLLLYYLEYFENNSDRLRLLFPLGRNSPLGDSALGGDNFAAYREPLQSHIEQLIEEEGCKISATDFTRMLWSFLIGISIQLLREVPHERILNDVEFFLSVIEVFIQHKKTEE